LIEQLTTYCLCLGIHLAANPELIRVSEGVYLFEGWVENTRRMHRFHYVQLEHDQFLVELYD